MNNEMKAAISLKFEEYGTPISATLSALLRKYTSVADFADVSRDTGVGSSTVRDVVYRRNSLTENNSKAIIELITIAVKNCELCGQDALKAKTELEAMIDE